MTYDGYGIWFDRLTATTYDTFHGGEYLGFVVETLEGAVFYPERHKMTGKRIKAATKAQAVYNYLANEQ